ncbi:MAG: hypothetical protein QNK03_28095, partial [Myxococcota bacterium]|nr:hypothetical protein [Myxococcota bacterium]
WIEAECAGYDPEEAAVLGTGRVMGGVFYWPPSSPSCDLSSGDFRSFARGRRRFVTETPGSRAARVVRLFPASPEGEAMENFGFYSYFFYLDVPTRRSVHALLRRMQAKAPYTDLAARVSARLGDFNAVHIRRGDFKQTFGVTTRDRRPEEAIRVLDESFARDQTLVILTDERDDPFFEAITAHFPDSVFLDHHILDEHREEFLDLPCHDSIALAHLSQLVAADSRDFVGSMTSTYTSLVQRLRGNRGRREEFKFLWNELPDPDVRPAKRGSHPPSDSVPLHPDGRLVEEGEGPYSWNRYNPRLAPAWQREWPESFLEDFGGDAAKADAVLASFRAERNRLEGGPGSEGGPARGRGPAELEIENLCVVRDPIYRLGDIVFKQGVDSTRYRNGVRKILGEDAYRNTILRRYLAEEQRRGLADTKQVTPEHFEMLRGATAEHIRANELRTPDPHELVFHIRIGDKEQHRNRNTHKYLGLIRKARLLFDVEKVTIVTSISFAQPIVTVANTERRKNEAVRYLESLFDALRGGFPEIRFGLKSSEVADEDFCYLARARYLVPSIGFFSRAAAQLLEPGALIFPALQHEPYRARRSSTLADPAYD